MFGNMFQKLKDFEAKFFWKNFVFEIDPSFCFFTSVNENSFKLLEN